MKMSRSSVLDQSEKFYFHRSQSPLTSVTLCLWSWLLLFTGNFSGWTLSLLVTSGLLGRGSLFAALTGDLLLLLCGGSASASALGVDNSDTSVGESASTSVVGDSSSGQLELKSVDDSSSLLAGRGMDILGSVLTCSLPFSWFKVVSLYVMGSLGLRVHVDVLEAALQGELVLEFSLSELLDLLVGVLVGADSVDVE